MPVSSPAAASSAALNRPEPGQSIARRALASLVVLTLVVSVFAGVARAARADEKDDKACQQLINEAVALMQEADKTGDLKKAVQAASLLDRASRLCRENLDIPFWTSMAYLTAKQEQPTRAYLKALEDALAARALALNRSPKHADVLMDPRVHYLKALIHFTFESLPGMTLQELEIVVGRSNNTFMPVAVSNLRYWAHLGYANQMAHAARWEDAIRHTQLAQFEARGDLRRFDQAQRNLAQIFRAAERWKESQDIWEVLVKRYPNDAIIRYGFASTLADQNKFEEAAAQWVEVLRLAKLPNTVELREADTLLDASMRYGVCLTFSMDEKVREQGKAQLLEYAKAYPNDARVWFHLGHSALEIFDDPDHAKEWLEKAYNLDPNCERTLRNLLSLYTTARPDPEKAGALKVLLESESEKLRRKKETERRKSQRPDGTAGCE